MGEKLGEICVIPGDWDRGELEVTAGGLPQSQTEIAGLGLQEKRERRSSVVSLPASLARVNCGFN